MDIDEKAHQLILMHYGVKGMKWGVRKATAVSATTATDVGVIKRQTKVTTTGGESHPAHEDAIKAAIQQQKFKKSGAAALSNQELRDLSTRIQLEEQVKSLTTKKGKKFAQRELESAGRQHLQRGLGRAAPQVARRARRGAATAATVAALL
jgi:hypothetical protein